jgi:hypothetical protein
VQNLKVAAQRTKKLLQDEEPFRYTCAHQERGEAEATLLKFRRVLPLLKSLRAGFVRVITVLLLSLFCDFDFFTMTE